MQNSKKLLSVLCCFLCLVLLGTMAGGLEAAAAAEKSAYVPVTGVEIVEVHFPDVFPYPDSVKLSATVSPDNATNKKVTWSSSDKSVAVVDKNGLVTSKKKGSITITVTTEDGGFTDSYTFSLHPKSTIQIVNPPATLLVEKKTTLNAKVSPYNYAPYWTSSNPKVATIDAKTGALVAKSPGTVEIKAIIGAYHNSPVAVCMISVYSYPYLTLKIGSFYAIQNGQLISDNVIPYTQGGRTMVPVRFVGEKMGGKVSYTSDKDPIYVKLGDTKLALKINSKTMTVTQGKTTKTVTLDVAATKREGRVYLPLRAVSEALGFYVKYEANSDGEYVVLSKLKLSAAQTKERMAEARKFIPVPIIIVD